MIGDRRLARLATLLRKEIADVVEHKLRDPRLGMVSVTSVKVSADLSSARVYVAIVGDTETAAASLETLRHAASYVRTEVAKKVRIRQMPFLRFFEDSALKTGTRVDELLDEWRQEAAAHEEH